MEIAKHEAIQKIKEISSNVVLISYHRGGHLRRIAQAMSIAGSARPMSHSPRGGAASEDMMLYLCCTARIEKTERFDSVQGLVTLRKSHVTVWGKRPFGDSKKSPTIYIGIGALIIGDR
jgi:hypothetical protein